MLKSNLTAIHPKIWLADFRLAEKSCWHVWLLQFQLSGVIARSSTYTQWKKSATINLIIHKASTYTKLHNPTCGSGVGLRWVTRGNFLTCLLGRQVKHRWLIVGQLSIKAGWWDALLKPRDLSKTICLNKAKDKKNAFSASPNKIFCLTPPPPTH